MRTSNAGGRQSVAAGMIRDQGADALRRCLWDGVLIVGFYATYASIRNMQGGRTSPPQEARARSNGLAILGLEERLGLDHEAAIQSFFLRLPALMKASNIFYATAHFTVTATVLFTLTMAGGRHHSRWRNVLGLATALALLGFAVYPTMPPRLLPDHPALIDTLSEIGGFWSFETPAIERIADPYAAMPSLHLVSAGWVACAVWGRLTRHWMKAIAITYPLVTLVVVVATANHYLLDVIAGLAVLGLAWLLVRGATSLTQVVARRRLLRRVPEPAEPRRDRRVDGGIEPCAAQGSTEGPQLRAVEENPGDPRHIVTMRGLGYKLVD